jgi:hypothetical protein
VVTYHDAITPLFHDIAWFSVSSRALSIYWEKSTILRWRKSGGLALSLMKGGKNITYPIYIKTSLLRCVRPAKIHAKSQKEPEVMSVLRIQEF